MNPQEKVTLMPKKRSKFELFQLEAREVPAVFGQPWVDSATLDVSFAPDGTDVAGAPSDLGKLFGTGTAWKNEIRRALQTWSSASNINFSWATDSGTSFSMPRPLQGSTKDGDIRIAARPLSGNVLAITNPFDLVSNWSGEIVLNSNVNFKVGSGSGTFDLYTVMLQEVGHSLGIGNSVNTNSVMFETYVGTRTKLDPSDVASAQALYGVRQNDTHEGTSGNNSTSTASSISYVQNSQDSNSFASVSAISSLVTADISSSNDVDVYTFTAPSQVSNPYLLLRTSGVSFLNAKVSVTDSVTKRVVLNQSASAAGENIELDLTKIPGNLVSGRKYFITVEKASWAYRTGRYQLLVGKGVAELADKLDFDSFNAADRALPLLVAGTNISSAADLGAARPKGDGRWDYYGNSSLFTSFDVDVYKVTTQANTGTVMVATVWTDSNSRAIPRLRVTDAAGNTLNATVLRADNGVNVIQVEGVLPSTAYYVHVNQIGPFFINFEKYRIGVDFRTSPIQLNTLVSGVLTATQNTSESVLNITRSQLMKFEVSAAGSTAGTKLSVLNSSGKELFTLQASASQTVTGSAFFMPGSYLVRISGVAAAGTDFTQVITRVRFLPLTDPIGPEMIDPIGPTSPPTSPPVSPPLVPPPPPAAPSEDPGFYWDPILLVDPLTWWW
jgi:hypothetical protein